MSIVLTARGLTLDRDGLPIQGTAFLAPYSVFINSQ